MRRTISWLLLLALVVGGVATWRYDLADPWLDGLLEREPAAAPQPQAIAPPPGLDLPALTAPPTVADAVTETARLSDAKVAAALAPYLDDPELGPHVLATVAPLAGGPATFTRGAGGAIPASTTKLVTAAAALLTMGPDRTFDTRVVSGGGRRIVLIGGGDPLLASAPATKDEPVYPLRADVTTLARETADALQAQGIRRVLLQYDASLFTGPSASPRWEPDYVPDGVVSPITSLWVEEGRSPTGFGRVADPALAAATTYASALTAAGIKVRGAPTAITEPAPADGDTLATVTSPSLREIVEHVLLVSDNEAAEVLLRHVGLASTGEASFAGGRRGVVRALSQAGVDLSQATLYDGSGLSRPNRMSPQVLVDVLRLATTDPVLGAVLTGLPVAGFTGSLAYRFEESPPPGRGRVRAKTGTLTGVSSLAGIITDLDGHPMLFALMADRVALEDTLAARGALDDAAAALGACRCGRRPPAAG